MAGRGIGWRGFGLLALVLPRGNGGYIWWQGREPAVPSGFAGGNGRLEATEVDVATKIAGRVAELLPREGAGQAWRAGRAHRHGGRRGPAAAGPGPGGAGEAGDRRSRGRRGGGTQQPNAGADHLQAQLRAGEAKFPQRPATRYRSRQRACGRSVAGCGAPGWRRRAPPNRRSAAEQRIENLLSDGELRLRSTDVCSTAWWSRAKCSPRAANC